MDNMPENRRERFQQDKKLILPGIYMLHLARFQRKLSRAGNDMIVADFAVLMNENGERVFNRWVRDYFPLIERASWKIDDWLESMNAPSEVDILSDESINKHLIKRPFLAQVKIENFKERKQNKIKGFLPQRRKAIRALQKLGYRYRFDPLVGQHMTERVDPRE